MQRRAVRLFYREELGRRLPTRMPLLLRFWLTRLHIVKALPSSTTLRRRS